MAKFQTKKSLATSAQRKRTNSPTNKLPNKQAHQQTNSPTN